MNEDFNEIKILNSLRKSNIVKMLIAFCIFILLKNSIEKLFNEILVETILSKIKSSYLIDAVLIFVIMFSYIIYAFRLNVNYQVSKKTSCFYIFLIVIYCYYRFLNPYNYQFVGFEILNKFKYVDVLFLYFIGHTFLLFNNIINEPENFENQVNHGFEIDLPLNEKGTDLLKRKKFAIEISHKLNSTKGEAAFALGINGPWGSGKTSFLKMIEKNLDSEKTIIINFNAWHSSTANTIIQDFFHQLSESLEEYGGNVYKLMIEYSNDLLELNNSTTSNILKKISNKIYKEKSLNEKFIELNNLLCNIDKKIVIFIDDIDRLHHSEIYEILKLIRNSANFKNTNFVAAYDRDYIVTAITKFNDYRKDAYLEKIFQLEINLPIIMNKVINENLFTKLKSIVEEKNHRNLFEIINGSGPHKPFIISYYLINLRDVTRFINSFKITYTQIKDDVVFRDFFYLELLKLKYPKIVELIGNNPERYLELTIGQGNKNRYSYANVDDEKNTSTFSNIKLEIPELKPIDEKLIEMALSSIFNFEFSSRVPLPENSIIYPYSFDRYFIFDLLDGQISSKEFETNIIRADFEKSKLNVEKYIENGLRGELVRKLNDLTSFESKEDFEKIIRVILYLGNLPKNPKLNNDFSGYEDENLFEKLTNNNIIKLFYNNDDQKYKAFLFKIFKEQATSPFYAESDFLYFCNNTINNEYFSLSLDERIELCTYYFEEYLNELTELDNNYWHLFWKTKYRIYKPEGGLVEYEFPQKIQDLIEKFITGKSLKSFLEETTFYDVFENEKHFTLARSIIDVFKSPLIYENFLNTLVGNSNVDQDLLLEYINFISKFNFGQYKGVKFEFKYITPKKK